MGIGYGGQRAAPAGSAAAPGWPECVLTTHTPPQWMQDAADYVTEMHCVRHPYQKGIAARQGSNIKAEDHIVRITVRMYCQLLLRIGVRS